MIATLDTTVPVIDVYVLKYFGLALPYQNVSDRLKKTAEVYAKLCAEYQKIMVSREARIICDKFDRRFPSSGISDIKKVDFILWQIRD
jgi:hypothetical protein